MQQHMSVLEYKKIMYWKIISSAYFQKRYKNYFYFIKNIFFFCMISYLKMNVSQMNKYINIKINKWIILIEKLL